MDDGKLIKLIIVGILIVLLRVDGQTIDKEISFSALYLFIDIWLLLRNKFLFWFNEVKFFLMFS